MEEKCRTTATYKGSHEGIRLRTFPVVDRCYIFVYILHKECTALEVESYIKEELDDDDVTVIKRPLKRTDSSGFSVSCHRRYRDCLLDASICEQNVWARLYRPPVMWILQHKLHHDINFFHGSKQCFIFFELQLPELKI